MKSKADESKNSGLSVLNNRESLLSAVFDSIQDGLNVVDSDLTNILANPWMERMYAEQMPLVGRKCHEVYQQRKSVCPWCPSVEALETGQTHMAIVPYPSSSRPTRWIELSAYPLRSEGGETIGVIEHVKDITEKKERDQLLQQSEERYRALVDLAPDVIALIDRQGLVIELNEAFTRITGYPREEMLGRHLSELPVLRAMDVPAYLDLLPKILLGRIPSAIPFEYMTKDGQNRFAEARVSLLRLEGKDSVLLAILRDTTERVRAERELQEREEQLRQSQKMEAVGRLAGGIAHDFNNLLTAIQGYAELLGESQAMTGRSREWVSEIRSAAERATALTGQLLAFSRKQILKPATLELNDLLLNLENMLKRLIGEDIHLLISCSPLVKPVLADPSQLEQVVLNLVVNACDAMPTGGKLRIETEQVTAGALLASHHGVPPGTYVELSVSDTGCGMDEETLGSIFEPFFTTKPQGKGTGLGLSTVYGIVKQSGGYVWAESQINQGTTIRILLPESPEATTQAGIAGADGRFEGGRETILVVEDEEALRLLIQSSLDRLGYTVHSAASCPAALGVVGREGRIDLVITDILMPGGSGLELVNQLRHLHPNVKVLFMSGYSDAAIDRHGSLEPDIPLLVKPFGIKTLIKTVRRLFDPDG